MASSSISQYRDKNLIFYSNRDNASLTLLQELVKNPLLDHQFVKICIDDPRVKIPKMILDFNKIPVIVCPSFGKPILGEDAFTWLKANNFSEKSHGNMDFGNMTNNRDLSNEQSRLVDEFKETEYNGFHNKDYNHGFQTENRSVNSLYSDVQSQMGGSQADPTRIETYDDMTKSESKAVLAQRMEQLRMQRDNEYGSAKRFGGLEQPSKSNTPQQNTNNASDPLGSQMSAFGGLGSNLDAAYSEPQKLNDPRADNNGNNRTMSYDPNPPQQMSNNNNFPQVPNFRGGFPNNGSQNIPQMPNMNPTMNRGMNPGMPQQFPQQQQQQNQFTRGSNNPYTSNQPAPPNNPLMHSGMNRPPASLLTNTRPSGPMSNMTPGMPSSGIPEPLGSSSNFFQL
jgi:hypothetical protein